MAARYSGSALRRALRSVPLDQSQELPSASARRVLSLKSDPRLPRMNLLSEKIPTASSVRFSPLCVSCTAAMSALR